MPPSPNSPLRRATNHFAGVATALRTLAAIVLAVAAGAISTARAAESRIPIAGPVVITTPGSYVVTRDIVTTGTPVTVNGVTADIDLNGHTLATTDNEGSVIIARGDASLTIRNGHVSGGLTALDAFDSNGASSKLRLRVDGVEFSGSQGAGIAAVDAFEVVVTNVTIHDAQRGVQVVANAARTSVRLTGNQLRTTARAVELTGNGVAPFVRGGIVADNVVQTGADAGIVLGGSFEGVLVRGNTVTSGAGSGIYAGGGGRHRIESNVLDGCVGIGIEVPAPGCSIVHDTVLAGGSHGISVTSIRNVIDGNTLTDNAGDGLHITNADNVFRNNVSRGSGGVAYSEPLGTTDGGGNL